MEDDDGRTTDHGYTISSPMSLGSGELKMILQVQYLHFRGISDFSQIKKV